MENEENDEKLDPRIQSELEKLNAATDGINHLETEFGEAQVLFQQMMQDATFQLKNLNQELGSCVEKSRSYYEALKQARHGHSQLHDAALKFEQAQSRHYNSKKRVSEAERRSNTVAGKLDPALQEMLNQATIEVMEAATASGEAWEIHRAATVEFDEKQKAVHILRKKFNKHIMKSRPYFELKSKWNKQLDIQKQRLEKIQEGIVHAKVVYSDTLHNLELISDDIHRSRQEKTRSHLLIGQRGEGVGAEIDTSRLPHDKSMDKIRKVSLDQLLAEESHFIDDDTLTTGSISSNDDSTSTHDRLSLTSGIDDDFIKINHNPRSSEIPSICVDNESNNGCVREAGNNDDDEEETERSIKEKVERIDSSYDVITSHSIKSSSPDSQDILQEFDFTDGGRRLLNKLNEKRRARSMTDLTSLSVSESRTVKGKIVDISKPTLDSTPCSDSTEDVWDISDSIGVYERTRCKSLPRSTRKWSSFNIGIKPEGYGSPSDTPESRKKTIANFAALTVPSLGFRSFPSGQ